MFDEAGNPLEKPVEISPQDDSDLIAYPIGYAHLVTNIDELGVENYTIRMRSMTGKFYEYSKPCPDILMARSLLEAHRIEMCMALVFTMRAYREDAFQQQEENCARRLSQDTLKGHTP